MTPSSRSPSTICDGTLARQAAAHLHLDSRVEPAVGGDVRQEVERGRLVGADREAAGRVVAQLRERVVHLRAQVVEPAGVVEHHAAGIGQNAAPCRSGRSGARPAPPRAAGSASDTAGCVRNSFSAAREKLRSVATARNTCREYHSIRPPLPAAARCKVQGCKGCKVQRASAHCSRATSRPRQARRLSYCPRPTARCLCISSAL